MADWLHELPVIWMTVVIFAGTYAMPAAIYGIVVGLAAGERARAFKAVSPSMLPPLGIMFGLFVAFVAAQVWGDNDRAIAAVTRKASALRAVVLLAAASSASRSVSCELWFAGTSMRPLPMSGPPWGGTRSPSPWRLPRLSKPCDWRWR